MADIGDELALHLFHALQIARGLDKLRIKLVNFPVAGVPYGRIIAVAQLGRRGRGFHQRPGNAAR